MTIALSLHVNDGIVLAADSAASIWAKGPDGKTIGVINVYENADKVFNLSKGLPIGAITWGSGSVGKASVSTLVKDFRKALGEEIDPNSYKISDIVKLLSEFIYEDNYKGAFKDWDPKPNLGFMVAGYSSNTDFAEEWKFDIKEGNLDGPTKIRGQDEVGLTWNGEPEAITRLYFGYGHGLEILLQDIGFKNKDSERILEAIRNNMGIPFVVGPMPIQDAIDLARFFVETTINFSKFKPGPPTVGGPIDIAAITKHEGFKWIDRKHYFGLGYNPPDEG